MVPLQALPLPGVAAREGPGSLFLPISGLTFQRRLNVSRSRICPTSDGEFRNSWRTGIRRIHVAGRPVCSASSREVQSSRGEQSRAQGVNIFGAEQNLPVPQSFLKDWPAPTRYLACTVIVAGALAGGYALGRSVKGTQEASIGGAVALGAVGSVTAFALNATAPSIAAVHLHNALVNHPNPGSLTEEEVDSIVRKFGVKKSDDRFLSELRDLYDRFITSTIPPGNEDLRGNEADEIIRFKNALGLEDPDAASVHIEVGRRIFRQRMETGDKEQAVEERRTFQKLVYVSQLVFGEASKFLLPWKRIFKVTDSQVDVAIRDNSQRFFLERLDEIADCTNINNVTELRRLQLKSKLPDELAGELVRNHCRKQLEAYIGQAQEVQKSRAQIKDTKKIVRILDEQLAFNSALVAVTAQAQANASSTLPGLGPASVLGGQYESERQMDDLKQLYRTYLQESFGSGILPPEKAGALAQLKNIFGFGNREADAILLEVTTKVYRRRLATAVNGGALEAASSKAAYLQTLCEELQFDPRKAGELHEDIYRQKLEQCLSDGSLSDVDISALLRLRVLLCIPKTTVDAAHASICGRLFTKVVDEAIGAGVDGYDADMKAAVRNGVTGLRLTQEAAMEIASKAIRSVFVTYAKRSRSAGNRLESARELKKMVIFSNLVVSELIADIKGDTPQPAEAPKVEQPKAEEEGLDDELQMLQTLKKTKPAAELEARMAGKSQSEITLKDDFEVKERTDFYRTYLLYCLSGESTGMPMGTQIVTQRDSSEFVRLGQLGSILGLSTKEVAEVHKGLAEQAFRQQAQVILADGQLNKARADQLTELQQQLGLPSEAAQKVIKSITSTRMAGAIESAVSQGRLTVDEVKDLKAAGVDVDSMISKDMREKLFKKIIDGTFSAGTGDFSEEDIYDKIPSELGLDTDKTRKIVETLAKERLTNSLIQAVSSLRQKKPPAVIVSLNNLLACDKAVRSQPLTWGVKDELLDLFCLYAKSSTSDEKTARLQELLGIDDATAQGLKAEVSSGGYSPFGVEEEEFAF